MLELADCRLIRTGFPSQVFQRANAAPTLFLHTKRSSRRERGAIGQWSGGTTHARRRLTMLRLNRRQWATIADTLRQLTNIVVGTAVVGQLIRPDPFSILLAAAG